jgi:hypothetical protein
VRIKPGLRPLFVNRYEKVADRLLTESAEEHGDRVSAKVRVADIIDLDEIGVKGDLKGYGLQAHFDFVMSDATGDDVRFAVEFDGAQHWKDPDARRRDAMKDALCERAGLPLLRITSEQTRTAGRWPILNYLIDCFYFAEAFEEAQQSGAVPMHEPFIATSAIVPNGRGGYEFNALDSEARSWLFAAHEMKLLPCFSTDHFLTSDPSSRMEVARHFMAVAPGRYLCGQARVRAYRFPFMPATELADQLAFVEFVDQAKGWLDGKAVALNADGLAKEFQRLQKEIDDGGWSGGGGCGALVACGRIPVDISVHG